MKNYIIQIIIAFILFIKGFIELGRFKLIRKKKDLFMERVDKKL